MNKADEDRQIRETRSLLQKAGQRNAPLDTRREALRRLISLTHMPSRELKVFAAQNFNHYFKDFPDLEEDVIDSVYDICEDSDAQVRIEGYKAIVSLSAESRKWTRRNTDVLVQLLQSDEPAELKQIQDSLIAHVNLDPAAAIGVLCDHCSLDPDFTPEEKEDREKLRKLVLFFLANTAKKDIYGHFRESNGEVEQVFRDGLVKAIAGTDVQETELIVKDLLLPLESYSPRSEHGDELLRCLLDKVKLTYADLKSKPGTLSLAPLQSYLSLLEYVAVVRRAADPSPILRFYSTALIGKMALQRLDPSSQMNIIQRLADILSVFEEERQQQRKTGASQELNSLRNTVVEACPHILERIVKSHGNDRRQWKTSLALLKACRQRQNDQQWAPPTNLLLILSELSVLADRAPPGVEDLTKQVQIMIKELRIEPGKVVQAPPVISVSGAKRKFEGNSYSPTVPSSRTSNLSMNDDRSQKESGAPISSGNQTFSESSPRGMKLINRLGGDVSMGEPSSVKAAPALLQRLSSSSSSAEHASNGSFQFPVQPELGHSKLSTATPPTMPMLSIKGAASKSIPKAETPQAPTLIDRMQLGELSHDSPGSWKKKRRPKSGGG